MALVCSCSQHAATHWSAAGQDPVTVGIVFDDGTKTQINPDGTSVSWSNTDNVSLWALTDEGKTYLDGQVFFIYAKDEKRTVFSSQLASQMPQGQYSYYACYPVPESVTGSVARFTVPVKQDGRAGAGADIMVSGVVSADALQLLSQAVTTMGGADNMLHMNMHHMVHLLKFYLPKGERTLDGEAVERAEISMPGPIAGSFSVDLANPTFDLASVSDASSKISVDFHESDEFVCVAVLPCAFGSENGSAESSEINIRLFSDRHFCNAEAIHIDGRDFKAGHTTSARLAFGAVQDLFELDFFLEKNNLGESVRYISFSTLSGKPIHEGSSTYTFGDGSPIPVGTSIGLYFDDQDIFKALSGEKVNITYESAHIRMTRQVSIPSIGASDTKASVSLSVPYLLYEDFSSVPDLSWDDAYTGGFDSGNREGHAFLNGWSGGRIGAKAGKCVRTAARRETSARYHARMDSAPLGGEIIAPVNLKVSFDYGTNNRYGGIGSGDYGQNVFVGYITTADVLKSGDTSGSFEAGNDINTNDKNTDWTTPKHASFTISNVEAGSMHRICWRAEVENHAGTNNTTCWCYLDNVVVTVAE